MENKKVEDILLDINEKIKNRNTFTWKWWFGWLIMLPYIFVGSLFISNGSYYDHTNQIIGIIIIFVGFLTVLKNWIQGIVALYNSTKHSTNVKKGGKNE